MDGGNVQSLRGVTLVGEGPLTLADVSECLSLAPTLVAADGGANFCVAHDLRPEAVIGDFDSVDSRTHSALPGTRFIEVSEQETTDFEKSLMRIEAPFVLAAGFSSGRLDHTLSNLSIMARRVGPPVVMVSESDVAIAAPDVFAAGLESGTRISLFPLARTTAKSTGLKWPLDGLRLDPLGMVGTSNRATGPVEIHFSTHGCLVIMPREELARAVEAITG